MLSTGNQLKAARALAGFDQAGLAERASVNVNTIRNMESKGGNTLTSGFDVVRKVQAALEAVSTPCGPFNPRWRRRVSSS